jgi:hypothetical protein
MANYLYAFYDIVINKSGLRETVSPVNYPVAYRFRTFVPQQFFVAEPFQYSTCSLTMVSYRSNLGKTYPVFGSELNNSLSANPVDSTISQTSLLS